MTNDHLFQLYTAMGVGACSTALHDRHAESRYGQQCILPYHILQIIYGCFGIATGVDCLADCQAII